MRLWNLHLKNLIKASITRLKALLHSKVQSSKMPVAQDSMWPVIYGLSHATKCEQHSRDGWQTAG